MFLRSNLVNLNSCHSKYSMNNSQESNDLKFLVKSIVPEVLHIFPISNNPVFHLILKKASRFKTGIRKGMQVRTGYLMSRDCRTAAASSPHIISFNSTVSDIAYLSIEAVKINGEISK